MRKFIAAGFATACIAAFGMSGPVLAQEGDDQRSSYVDDHFSYVPLQLKGGAAATVRRVLLNVGGQVRAADPEAGVERIDQNRLDWGGIPLIGGFANERYNDADFTPNKDIGDVYFSDGTVWLDLSDETPDRGYPGISFLNQKYAYRLSATPAPAPTAALPDQPPGNRIGTVYRGSDGRLLVLVRPFIVTDTLF